MAPGITGPIPGICSQCSLFIIPVVPCICYYKIVISMAQYGGMSLTRLRKELRKQHAKVSARKKYLAVGDNGVSFTPVIDTWTARSLLMLCFVHVVSSLKLVIYHDCHIYVIWANCHTHAIGIPWHSIAIGYVHMT